MTKFSDEQKRACVAAFLDRGIRPAGRVRALAAAGTLTDDGDGLDPFDPPEYSIRDWSKREQKRRAGNIKTTATDKPLPEVVDDLTTRLTNLAVSEVTLLETAARKSAKTNKPIDTVRLQRAIRTVRELAALIPGENAPPRPGRGGGSQKGDAPTRTGLASAILAANAQTPEAMTATPDPQEPRETTEATERSSSTTQTPEQPDHHQPGIWADAEAEGLPVGREAIGIERV